MKLFIFGAGASLGSQRDAHIPPYKKSPLIKDLFDRTYRNYSDDLGFSSSIMQELENKSKEFESVEKWLTHRWDAISKIDSEHKKMAELKIFGAVNTYLRWLFQNVSDTYNRNSNWYSNFLDKLIDKGEHFGIISFNYDTLLDRAFEDTFGPFVRLEDYFERRYIKPHGSVNWFLPKRDSDRPFPVHEQTPNVRGRYDLASAQMYIGSHNFADLIVRSASDNDLKSLNFIRSEQFQSQYFYPLIILPLISKQFQNVIGFERIIDEGKKLMKMARDIYLIGYRAEDELIREMLSGANQNTYIHVIALTDAESIREKVISWNPELCLQRGGVHHAGFSNYVVEYLRSGLI